MNTQPTHLQETTAQETEKPNIFLESMASSLLFLALVLVFSSSVVALGETVCERLDQSTCAFAVSSSGLRCVLEKRMQRGGKEVHVCRTSGIEADRFRDWVETDECVEACGFDRNSLGISSDSLLESRFTEKLCSTKCSSGCPNIVDLYFSLAAAEGVFLPKLCEAQRGNPRRAMAEIRSSGEALAAAGLTPGRVVIAAGRPQATPPTPSPM